MTLSHLDENGEVHMVDISSKERSRRLARAECSVIFPNGLLKDILDEGTQKGDLFATARLGGIQGAKKTPELIPLTHPIALDHAKIELGTSVPEDKITVQATVKASDATGVEMEALNAASTAALTLYDMCKSKSKNIKITNLHLLEKAGGKSGHWKDGGS